MAFLKTGPVVLFNGIPFAIASSKGCFTIYYVLEGIKGRLI